MSLGETIYRLRSERGLSQEELADTLEVSRQSISKWETNSSVPELEKLIKLSNVFGVTMDELVLGKQTEPASELSQSHLSEIRHPTSSNAVKRDGPHLKTVGLILLCFGALVLLLLTLMGGFLTGLMFSSPFLLCGIVCLAFQKHIGLWCAWALFFAVNVYLRYATGIRWTLTLWTLNYEPSMNYLRLAFAWLELLCINALVLITVLRFRKKPLPTTKRNIILWTLGCLLLALLFIHTSVLDSLAVAAQIQYIFSDWLRLPLFTLLLTSAVRLIHTHRAERIIAE